MDTNDHAYRIQGVVIDLKNHSGVKGLRVEAWDKGFFSSGAIGSAETGESGAFEISLDKNQHQSFFKYESKLYFKVFHHDDCIANTENSISWSRESCDVPVLIPIEKPAGCESTSTQSTLSAQATTQNLAPPDHFVRGRLTDPDKQGLSQYAIVLSEYDLEGTTKIDSVISSKYGAFEFEFALADSLRRCDGTTKPDLVFQVFDPTGAEVEITSLLILDGVQETAVSKLSDSNQAPFVLMNAPATLDLRIVIDLQNQSQHIETKFEQLVARLKPFMCEVKFVDLKEDEANFQISFLSKESGVEKAVIEQLRDAFKHERDSNGIPAWVFYELATQAITITGLTSMAVDAIVSILKPNQPQCDSHDLEAIAGQLLQYGNDQNIQTQVDNLKATVGDLLQPILASEEKLTTFLDAYARHDGDTESFWQAMSQHKDFQAQVPKIQLNLQLSQLTLNNSGLVQALQQEGIESTRQLVDLSAQKWEALAVNNIEGIPPHITGKDELERAKIYARELQTLVELAFPTEVIKKNVQHVEVRTFLDRNPDFDFTRTSVESYLYDRKEQAFHGIQDVMAVKTQLRKMQRLYTLTANICQRVYAPFCQLFCQLKRIAISGGGAWLRKY